MNTVLVEILSTASGDTARETNTNAPAVETQYARLEQLGAFRDDSIGANQTAAAMTYQGIDAAAPLAATAGRKGQIIGVVAKAISTTTIGAIASGTMTAQATIGGVAVGETVVLTATTGAKSTIFATPVDFAVLDGLGINLASASLSPTTSRCHAQLLIRWTAESA